MNHREQGIVSLTISIIVSILLMVVVLGMFAVMIRVQREATDADLSIRAHYAAEAGVEDALVMISRKLTSPTGLKESDFTNTCENSGAELTNSSYTCQRLSHNTNQLTGVLTRDGQPVQFDIGNVNYDKIVIKWNTAEDSIANGIGTSSYTPPANFLGAPSPDLGVDKWTHPAVLEVSTIAFPNGGVFDIATDPKYQFYSNILRPGVNPSPIEASPDTTPNVTGDCTQVGIGGGYNCIMTLTNVSNPSTAQVLRLRARYAGTHYSVQFLKNNGTIVEVPDQFATIDVTARAGDVYRRIIYKLRLETGAAAVDYVIYSDTDICKNYQISLGVTTGCPF